MRQVPQFENIADLWIAAGGGRVQELEAQLRRAVLKSALIQFNFNQCKVAKAVGLHRNRVLVSIKECGLYQWMVSRRGERINDILQRRASRQAARKISVYR